MKTREMEKLDKMDELELFEESGKTEVEMMEKTAKLELLETMNELELLKETEKTLGKIEEINDLKEMK